MILLALAAPALADTACTRSTTVGALTDGLTTAVKERSSVGEKVKAIKTDLKCLSEPSTPAKIGGLFTTAAIALDSQYGPTAALPYLETAARISRESPFDKALADSVDPTLAPRWKALVSDISKLATDVLRQGRIRFCVPASVDGRPVVVGEELRLPIGEHLVQGPARGGVIPGEWLEILPNRRNAGYGCPD